MSLEPERTETIIVGAGPAGLAVAACLQRAEQPFILLERADTVAASWRSRYRRLHLHTNRGTSALPYRPFPRSYPRYPSREQVIAYLDGYAAAFDLQPRFGETVGQITHDGEGWYTQTERHAYRSRNVVIASGAYGRPLRPTWPGQDAFRGTVVHSSAYIDGSAYAGQRVLVVGYGNSGAEIALDLFEHGAVPTVAVRGIPIVALSVPLSRLPSRLTDALAAPIVRLALGDLAPLGLQRPPFGPFTQVLRERRIPAIDVGTVRMIRAGKIAVRPGIDHFTADGVVFADGRAERFDAVILATGFGPDASLIDPTSQDAPGLYVCGFSTPVTGLLREIGREAKAIARDIQQRNL